MLTLQSPNDLVGQQELRERIDFLRAKLIKTGLENGFQHVQTIKISQDLDEHIAQYQIYYQQNSRQ
ncbi:Spo0E family sporulation regulatory protein-aspartic acid phosphatase [Cytobacillus gottheilii]|uniref:Aspartyl-phosphate phosphatase Spo0E family protein n=1 Tax=Cytobacillus gottheilii TaxID=859144 RepID=A0ABX8FG62_9BACI|nr:aspartyl-phosphate phosphatase Spo0E family protein [Cytobacillus gottheilii]QVY63019.1 aspartyl-phosphate phosphatase Spo0E family protein [Cytobacillus gottheilii]